MTRESVRRNQQLEKDPKSSTTGHLQRIAVTSVPETKRENEARNSQENGFGTNIYYSFLDMPLVEETKPAIQRKDSNYSVHQSIQVDSAYHTITRNDGDDGNRAEGPHERHRPRARNPQNMTRAVIQRAAPGPGAAGVPRADNPTGITEIRNFLTNAGPPNSVLRRQQNGCYALVWNNPGLTGNPGHIIVDVHYNSTGGGYQLGHTFVQGWAGDLHMGSPLRRNWVAHNVPAADATNAWPANPNTVITGGYGPNNGVNPCWVVREH